MSPYDIPEVHSALDRLKAVIADMDKLPEIDTRVPALKGLTTELSPEEIIRIMKYGPSEVKSALSDLSTALTAYEADILVNPPVKKTYDEPVHFIEGDLIGHPL